VLVYLKTIQNRHIKLIHSRRECFPFRVQMTCDVVHKSPVHIPLVSACVSSEARTNSRWTSGVLRNRNYTKRNFTVFSFL